MASGSDEQPVRMLRVGAYAVVVVEARLLLTQMAESTPVPGQWGLPGGGVDHGEAPLAAVVREVHEETAHELVDVRLVDVGSHHFVGRSPRGRLEDFHSVQIVYTAGVREVREPEVLDVGGSTVQARWVPLGEVPALDLTSGTREWLTRLRHLPSA
ncbi:MAG TPA: NUDIX domain-containing protein [Angustibacter sp.]|nr:NUDIX domain-containing protein [Angustibacter sp.]